MHELITTIDEITRVALEPAIATDIRVLLLEKYLIKLYYLSFELVFDCDVIEYPESPEAILDFRHQIESNFKTFGLYKTVPEHSDIYNSTEFGIGDAVDDLAEILIDSKEIKRRIENNSINDGLWYFNLIFQSHTKKHVVNLLNYINFSKY